MIAMQDEHQTFNGEPTHSSARSSIIASAELWLPTSPDGACSSVASVGVDTHSQTDSPAHLAAAEAADARRARVVLAQGDAGVAFPCFDGDRLTGVVAFHLTGHPEGSGALELWTLDHARQELRLTGAHMPGLDRLDRVTRLIGFPIGAGLPGRTWQRGSASILHNLEGAAHFMRATETSRHGLSAGVGVPVFRQDEVDAVLLALTSRLKPLFRVFEVWAATSPASDAPIKLRESIEIGPGSAPEPDLDQPSAPEAIAEGLVRRVAETRVPVLIESPSQLAPTRAQIAQAVGATRGVAWPASSKFIPGAVVMLW